MATIHLTKGGFERRVADIASISGEWKFLGNRPAVIDFYATWCGPCKALLPVVEQLSEEYDGKVIICKCDVGEDGDEIAAQYRVRNVPTILFFKGGQQVDKHVGTADKEQLKAKIDALL